MASLIPVVSTKGLMTAFRAHNIPEAVIKGMGNAIIVNRVNALLGNPLGSVGLSFIIPGIGVTVTPFTVLNYFLLNGMQLKLDVPALIGAIAAVFAGVNPGIGTIAGTSTPQGVGSGSRLGGL